MTNSSPPTRATVSVSRTIASKRLASDFQHEITGAMPAYVVHVLEAVEVDRDEVNGSPERRERRNACSMRSSSSPRFGKAGEGSRSASE